MNYSFDVGTAKDYGLDEAVLIHNFQYWIEKNKANKRHGHDDHTWTYNTYSALADLFPFWSIKQIRRIIESLVNQEVLITGNYNKKGFDRTIWYAFKHESEWLRVAEALNCPNGQMDVPKRANGCAQTGTPIPDSKPDSKPDIEDLNLTAWNKWIDFRRVAKFKTYKTDATAKALSKIPHDQQMKCVQSSIDNEYQGIFPERFKNEKHTSSLTKPGGNSLKDFDPKADWNPVSALDQYVAANGG